MHHLYYCPGGGLGHIARAHRVMAALAPGEPYTLVSASPALRRADVRCGAGAIELPRTLERDRTAHRAWLTRLLVSLAPCCLWVDAFPAGIVGELCDFCWPRGVLAQHIARRLRWDVYCRRLDGAIPDYAAVHAVESLPALQAMVLRNCTDTVAPLELPLAWPRTPSPLAVAARVLVVHSGIPAETAALADLARRESPGTKPLVVGTDTGNPDTLQAFPVWPMFAQAERIYSGAGFNAVLEARAAPHKHRLMAFERALDDQAARLADFTRETEVRARLSTFGQQSA
ncbi:MAG: hypothetical protein KF778_13265 [Rhodocyclaceae bacterium]|nr:hypothetical protein [Rhodocyclaceae bacterium]MBX3669364.1 hypothetical protein [Rhodocyclaceae bacterium]